MDWAADRIIEERCDLVLVAGDCFKDNRVFLDRASVEIRALVNWLRKLSGAGISVVIISGTPSHDPVSAYELIKEIAMPGVEIFTQPGITAFENISIACLPGMNRSNLVTQEEYRTLPPHAIHQLMTDKITQACQGLRGQCKGPAILLAHLTYDMADKGFEDVLMQHEPVLTQEAIQGFSLVALGHIHRPQQNGNVFYCGSPERLRFDDEKIEAGFWIHEIEPAWCAPEIKGVPGVSFDADGSYGSLKSRFIETPARRFLTINWNEDAASLFLRDGTITVPYSGGGEIVRLQYSCDETTAKLLDRKALEKALYEAGAFFVAEIKADVQRVDRARDQEVTESLGPVEALGKWAENQGIVPDEITVLQGMATGLLEEVAA
jgi:DNA repair exonuclease SbcCD nuclease subunit